MFPFGAPRLSDSHQNGAPRLNDSPPFGAIWIRLFEQDPIRTRGTAQAPKRCCLVPVRAVSA